MKRKPPKRFVPVAVIVGLLLLTLIGWFGFVTPQRKKAAKLSTEIASVRAEIQQNRILSRSKSTVVAVRLADVFRLSKAMPTEVDMPGILLELNRVAGQAGISFDSIAPQGEVATANYRMVSVQVVFTGNYYELSDLLYRLRNLVEVHDGELMTTGRLFTVDSVHFVEGKAQFPQLEATMTVNAFVYGGVAPPAGSAETTPTDTGATTTPPAPASASSGPAASASSTGVNQ